MSEAVRARRGNLRTTLKRFVPLPERLEGSTVMDRPIAVLTRAIRQRLGTGVIRDVLHGVPMAAGTDANRANWYQPWASIWWLVTGGAPGGWCWSAPAVT